MKYESKNQGLLSVEMVKAGEKLIILEIGTYFSDKRQIDVYQLKVELPNKLHKMCSPMDTCLDLMADKWGSEDMNAWIGRTLIVEIRTSKTKGTDYLWFVPSDDPQVVIAKTETPPVVEQKPVEKIPYPTEEINPDDIPF
jgi:hypothetical protein